MNLSKQFFFKLFLLCFPFLLLLGAKYALTGENFSLNDIYSNFVSMKFNTSDIIESVNLLTNTFKHNILGVNNFFANVDGIFDWLKAFGNFVSAIWEFIGTLWNLLFVFIKSTCQNIGVLMQFFIETIF